MLIKDENADVGDDGVALVPLVVTPSVLLKLPEILLVNSADLGITVVVSLDPLRNNQVVESKALRSAIGFDLELGVEVDLGFEVVVIDVSHEERHRLTLNDQMRVACLRRHLVAQL